MGNTLGAPRLYPRVNSRLYPGIVQNIPGYSSVGAYLGGYTGMENVTHLQNSTIFLFGGLKSGPAFEPLAHH